MNRERLILIVTTVICLSGCLVISLVNMIQAYYPEAEIIPAVDYYQSLSAEVSSSQSEQALSGTININTATAEELADALPGIGIVKARRIVEYREIAGGFASLEQLLNVDGIGEKTLESIRPFCRLQD